MGWVGEDDQLVAGFESEGLANLGGDRDLSSSSHGDGSEESAPSGSVVRGVAWCHVCVLSVMSDIACKTCMHVLSVLERISCEY